MAIDYLTKHCIFCGLNERIVDLYPRNFREEDLTPEVFSARRASEHFHYRIVRCENCGLVFSREILPEEVLSRLYSQRLVTFDEYTGIISGDYLRRLKPFMGSLHKGAALEIGSSSGFFLKKLLDEGFESVYGCEPSVEAKNKTDPKIRENIHCGFFKRGVYRDNTFDLVCSFQTLDHLSDPAETIDVCRGILKPGGIAYFVVHDVDALQARVLKDRSPIIDVEHIYLFNKTTIRRLFASAGFDVLKVGDLKNSYPLDYWLKMLPMGRVGSTLRSILKALRLGAVSFPVAAGNIFIIARKHDHPSEGFDAGR